MRGGKSEISGERIDDPTPANFAHILAKGQSKFPLFKLYEKNIMLMTFEEHDAWDNGSIEKLKADPRWQKVFQLREELIEEYKSLQ